MLKKRVFFPVAIVLLLILVILSLMFSTHGKYYQEYSPDSQYSVYASKYNYELFVPRMPGQGGDGSGRVFLYDEVEKKVINSAPIAILWLAGDIEWNEDIAYFKGDDYPNILDPWHLPRPVKMPYTKIIETDTANIVKGYSSFDQLQSITVRKLIGSCWKSVSYIFYNDKGEKNFEWYAQYNNMSTCDNFSRITHYIEYKNNRAVKEYYDHSTFHDTCKTWPCPK